MTVSAAPSRLRLTAYAAEQVLLSVPALVLFVLSAVAGVLTIAWVGVLLLFVVIPATRLLANRHRPGCHRLQVRSDRRHREFAAVRDHLAVHQHYRQLRARRQRRGQLGAAARAGDLAVAYKDQAGAAAVEAAVRAGEVPGIGRTVLALVATGMLVDRILCEAQGGGAGAGWEAGGTAVMRCLDLDEYEIAQLAPVMLDTLAGLEPG